MKKYLARRTLKGFHLGVISVAFYFLSLSVAHAINIDWVDFSSWNPGDLSATGLSSADGLVLNATFTDSGVFSPSSPQAFDITVQDPAWMFSNTDISTITVGQPGPGIASTDLTVNFASAGGLPVGGSIGIIDLESPNSSVRVRGFQSGIEVNVDWTVAFYQTSASVGGSNPAWDSVTNTLTGTQAVGVPDLNDFVFLVTDIQLDSLILTIDYAPEDGIGFAASRQRIDPPLPIPATFLLVAIGLVAMWYPYRRTTKTN